MDTFIDLRLKATPQGARAWEDAVRSARRRRNTTNNKSSNNDGNNSDKRARSVGTEPGADESYHHNSPHIDLDDKPPGLQRRDSRIMQTPSPSPSPRSSRHGSPV